MNEQDRRPHIFIKDEPPAHEVRTYSGGGGGGTYPRTNYKKHASKVSKEAHELKAIFSKTNDSSIPNVYFKIELPEDHTVSTTSAGEKLEENFRGRIIGSPKENIAHLSATKEAFNDLSSELDRYRDSSKNTGKSKFASLERIDAIPFEEKISERFSDYFDNDESSGEALVSLYPDLSKEDSKYVIQGITNFLKKNNGEVVQISEGESGLILKVKSKKKILEELAKSFVSIQMLDRADIVLDTMAAKGDRIADAITVNPNISKAYAAIFDSGINQESRFLSDSIIEAEYPFGNPHGIGIGHGTFVGSRIIYGDSLKNQLSRGVLNPDVKVLSVSFSGFDDLGNKKVLTTDILIDQMRKTVAKWHKQIRVYNLSMSCLPPRPGLSARVKDDMVHTMAAEIDALSRKYDVLFIVCSGNFPYPANSRPSDPYPQYFKDEETRIMPPGDSMLAITVGSIAQEMADGSMAKKNEPSPFTRRGPGFGGYFKPDLVAHGGNAGNNWNFLEFLMSTGIHEDGESLAFGNGTSYSTPLVTRYAAKLFEMMPEASACLVKALLLHFSNKTVDSAIDPQTLHHLMGNGFPIPEKLSHSNKHEQTYLREGELDFREMVTIPFYVPKALVKRKSKRGLGKVKIRVTVTFYPETNALLKSGYCKSHIRTKIVKLNGQGAEDDVSFSECAVIDSDRYSTVIQMEKTFSTKIAGGEWGVFIAHESRWKLKNPKTKYAVVISIEDPLKDPQIDIHSHIRTEIPGKYRTELKTKMLISV
jgi:hypothetical protein